TSATEFWLVTTRTAAALPWTSTSARASVATLPASSSASTRAHRRKTLAGRRARVMLDPPMPPAVVQRLRLPPDRRPVASLHDLACGRRMGKREHDPEKACPGLEPGWIPVFGEACPGLDPGIMLQE